jgi:hypothetical protein
MRTKFLKYGKRMVNDNGQSEYFEASIEVGPGEDPAECARTVRRFVNSQLAEKEEAAPLVASIADRLGRVPALPVSGPGLR